MIQLINENFICVKINIKEQPKIARRFHILWTPTIVTLDHQEFRLRESVGFLPPEELLPELLMTLSLHQIRMGNLEKAVTILEELQKDFPNSIIIPEALYRKGIAIFFSNGDKSELYENWKLIARLYPESLWAIKTTLLNAFDDQLWPPLEQ